MNAVSGLYRRTKRVDPITAIFKERALTKCGGLFRILHTTVSPPHLLGRGNYCTSTVSVTQSTIEMRKMIRELYALSGRFLNFPHLLKCPQRQYMSHAIAKSFMPGGIDNGKTELN